MPLPPIPGKLMAGYAETIDNAVKSGKFKPKAKNVAIACEDTRHSRPLLEYFEVRKNLEALHDHNEGKKAPELIQRALGGESIAIISDAGMPSISDPGYRLMQACIAAEVEYTVLPGASAVLTALVGSGFPVHAFSFHGFLPVKKGRQTRLLLSS